MGHPLPIRELVNETGLLSTSNGRHLKVCFDLVEWQLDGTGKTHCYGRLWFPTGVDPSATTLLLSSIGLRLRGGGIELAVFLHGRNSFGAIGPIREVQERVA